MIKTTQPTTIGHYIQGQRATGTSARSQDVTNPATAPTLTYVAAG